MQPNHIQRLVRLHVNHLDEAPPTHAVVLPLPCEEQMNRPHQGAPPSVHPPHE